MPKSRAPAYWLLKSEPSSWSWSDQKLATTTTWDGVRNPQAKSNLRAMRAGDLCFFYHTGKERAVVGVVEVKKEAAEGERDVEVRTVGEMRRKVGLGEMRREEALRGWRLLKQSRLAVVEVEKKVWERVLEMGGGFEDVGGGK